MNIVSEDIKDLLVAESSLALTFATNLFIGKEPSSPDNCVTIYDTTGNGPSLGLDTLGYYYPTIQIRVRNKSYLDGINLIEKIKNVLHGRNQETWNHTLYTLINCSGSPALSEWDDNGNACFSINFNIQRRVE